MVRISFVVGALVALPLLGVAACGSDDMSAAPDDAGISLGDATPAGDAGARDSAPTDRDGGALRSDRFATKVVSFTPGSCAGFGAGGMPEIVLGPPVGAGAAAGSLDVVSLGANGELVLSFEPNAIVDGPGSDFIVFENAFYAGGDPSQPAADLGEISVSEDGVTWKTFTCTVGTTPPFGACAGWHPVYSNPSNAISPVDVEKAGGEAYDLADVGLTKARFVRIQDKSVEACDAGANLVNFGFDLDAIAIVNAESP